MQKITQLTQSQYDQYHLINATQLLLKRKLYFQTLSFQQYHTLQFLHKIKIKYTMEGRVTVVLHWAGG